MIRIRFVKDLKINKEAKVKVNTGKYKGKDGYFICWTGKHPLSSQRRAQIQVQTGLGWITLLINENNFTFLNHNA